MLSKTLTFEKLRHKLEFMSDKLERYWNAVNHLSSVKNGPEIRTAIKNVTPEVVVLGLKVK